MKHLTSSDKPTRRRVTARVPHGVTPQLIVTIYPGGIIGLRENRRRKEYQLDCGTLYVAAIRAELRRGRK